MLGQRIARPPKRRKRADQFIADATEIAEGDLVVVRITASAAMMGLRP